VRERGRERTNLEQIPNLALTSFERGIVVEEMFGKA